MWFYNNNPYKGTRPTDLADENSDSSGFAESPTLTRLALWLYVFAFVGVLAWVLK